MTLIKDKRDLVGINLHYHLQNGKN